ncbi:mannonate dehydratase [Flavobacterium cupreum]|uniref:mannonate dehydratase n=2 Tax=Flavobacterium TaxID=237 RepID=A0A4Y7UD89_9FLAO|nr:MULTISPECIES: mannonate dehydratase [Flavobacterium]RUT67986.1 mannonate dehydratase [Flavobacterium cupreum]TCN59012.1 mannonate dehydratase [Flavobacterium circumlabens]TEB44413.1 mannonate dehydratase [Flavobacterium circumlabens]
MKLSFLFFGNTPDEKWELCRQMGIDYAIAKLAPELTGMPSIDNFESFEKSKEIYVKQGFNLYGLEGDQFDMTRIKLGLPGKEQDIEKYCRMLENMNRLDVRLLCYNFMATGWYRTRKDIKERGGAIVSGFSMKEAALEPASQHGLFSENQIWDNYQWFIEQVMLVAESNGVKMALHPDDPPITPIHGISRILISAEAIDRALSFSQSPSHGLTFCQGTYTTMNEDVLGMIEKHGRNNKIFFVHIRDVVGTPEDFRETFHDNGPTDMFRMMQAYKAVGFDGPLRSDHVPTMAGESNEHFGYEMKGNLFGIGYIKGLMDACGIQ